MEEVPHGEGEKGHARRKNSERDAVWSLLHPVSGSQGEVRDRGGAEGGAAQGYGGILQEEHIHFRACLRDA